MPENVLLIDYEPVMPHWLYKDSAAVPGNVLTIDAEALVQKDATTMTAPQANDSDVAQPAPETKPSMSPSLALTKHFLLDASSDQQGKSGRTSQLLTGDELRQGFKIGELCLMIRYEDGSELAVIPAMHRLPNAPDWFCGIANMHGKLIPVFDLASFLAVDHNPRAKRMLLVLARGGDAAGVLIDGLPERLRRTEDGQADAGTAPERLTLHLRGISLIGERLWFDLDMRSLLDAIEQSLAEPH